MTVQTKIGSAAAEAAKVLERLGVPAEAWTGGGRDVLKDILENSVPATMQDVVIVFVTVSGMKKGHLMQETYVNKVFAQEIGGELKSAIQITTAGAICAVLDMLTTGDLPAQGFIRQEDIPLHAFLANRFGRYYAQDDALPLRAAAE